MSDLPDLAKEFLVVVPTTDRPNVRLSNVAANPLPISLNLAIHETAITTDPLRNMRSSFFLSPRGQLSIPVRIPPNRKLLAVECNGHRVPMSSIHFETSSESNSQFSIRLFSSSLPQKIALHTSGFSESDAVELESSSFPEIVDATPENSLVIIDSKDGAIGYGTQAIEVDQARQLLANSVVAVVEQASGFIAESSLSERRQWWKDWEDSTSTIWYEASLLQSDDFLSAISGRRHALFERLQLRALSQPPPPAAHPPVRPVAMPFVDTFQANPSTMHVRQYFLIDSEINATSALRIKPTLPPKGSWLDVDVWFGWSLWLVTAVFVIRYTQLRFDAWMVTLKQFFLHRPWWLFVAMGVLVLALAPNSWYGLGFIALSLYFVIRTYWYEVGRVA
jgi:hypothetical protein